MVFLLANYLSKRQYKPERSYYKFEHPDISVIQLDRFRPSPKELTVLYNNKKVTHDHAQYCATHDEPNDHVWVIPRETYLKMIENSEKAKRRELGGLRN